MTGGADFWARALAWFQDSEVVASFVGDDGRLKVWRGRLDILGRTGPGYRGPDGEPVRLCEYSQLRSVEDAGRKVRS